MLQRIEPEVVARTPASASTPPSEWWLDRQLAQTLYALIHRHDLTATTLERDIPPLEREHGDLVCAELIFLLSGVRLDPSVASGHWQGVLAHRSELSERLGRPVDLRVGLVSYFLDVNRRLDRPRIVEMDWSERAAASAYLDDLTRLPNRRFLAESLDRELQRSQRDMLPVSVVAVDIDDFKQVNDAFGHETGDIVLSSVARTLRANLRGGDMAARYGGEEFVLLLPATDKLEATRVVERLRLAVASPMSLAGQGSEPLIVTVSMGLATFPADAKDSSSLLGAADRALYQAKGAGKNQVCLSGGSTRSFVRRRAAWHGSVRELEPVVRPIQTVEIGESGALFIAADDLPLGSLLEIHLVAPNGTDIGIAGRVAWTRPLGDGRFEVAVRAIERGSQHLRLLARWTNDDPER